MPEIARPVHDVEDEKDRVNGIDGDGDERVLLCELMYRVYYRYPKEITPELRYHDSKSPNILKLSTYMTMTTY